MQRMTYTVISPGVAFTLLPENIVIRKFLMVNNDVRVYYEIDSLTSTELTVPYKFMVVGTGSEKISDDMQYLGTVQGDMFAWHIYIRRDS